LCFLGTNAISKATIFLNDSPGEWLFDKSGAPKLDVNGDHKYDPGYVSTAMEPPTMNLVAAQPWRDYSDLVVSPLFNYYTLPEGATNDELKNETAYYNRDEKESSLVELALHEFGHPFGLNHEGREMSNMGIANASAHGGRLMDWIGQDMTQFLNKVYRSPTAPEYRDLSVRHVKQDTGIPYVQGMDLKPLVTSWQPFILNAEWNPIYQTAYATLRRTRAYHSATSFFELIDVGKEAHVRWMYYRNPVERMVKGCNYSVEFVYENNGSKDDAGEQQVTFFLSKDDNIIPKDPINPSNAITLIDFVNSLSAGVDDLDLPIGPVDLTTNAIDPSIKVDFTRDPSLSALLPAYDDPTVTWEEGRDYWSNCYDAPYCTVTVRRSEMVKKGTFNPYSTSPPPTSSPPNYFPTGGLNITHLSDILIPPASTDPKINIPTGRYFLGVHVGPMMQPNPNTGILEMVEEHNKNNNATYMEIEIIDPTSPSSGC
jgi:hypothetical protein